jgi:putative Holliday junction resolvase
MVKEIRILALDVGEKRIGLAVSDPLGFTAQGLGVVHRQDPARDLSAIRELIASYPIQEIVVGVPRHLDGRPGTMADAILALAEALGRELNVPVVSWDERLTTVEAERLLVQADLSRKKRRRVVDQVAATLILQSYLDWRRRS